jgi:hypothetical protein
VKGHSRSRVRRRGGQTGDAPPEVRVRTGSIMRWEIEGECQQSPQRRWGARKPNLWGANKGEQSKLCGPMAAPPFSDPLSPPYAQSTQCRTALTNAMASHPVWGGGDRDPHEPICDTCSPKTTPTMPAACYLPSAQGHPP